jgi:hypothetical protein
MGRMPTMDGHTHMLDLGANVDSGPKALVEFAVMGSIAVKYTENINSRFIHSDNFTRMCNTKALAKFLTRRVFIEFCLNTTLIADKD